MCSRLVVFFLATCIAVVRSLDHTAIIQNLMSFGETELAIFKDNDQDVSEILDIKDFSSTVKIFNIDDVNNKLQINSCPAWSDKKYVHQPIYPSGSEYRRQTIIVSARQLDKVTKVFDNTVLNCSMFFEPGIYHMDSQFLFLVKSNENAKEYSNELFYKSQYMSKHRHVTVVKQFSNDTQMYLVFGLNMGSDKSQSRLLYIWKSRSPPVTLEDGFYGKVTTNYMRHKFTIVVPFIKSAKIFCKEKIRKLEELGPGEDNYQFLGCQGIEVEQAKFAMEMYNFTWGIITGPKSLMAKYNNKTGKWFGFISEVVYGRTDYMFVNHIINQANRVFHPTHCSIKPGAMEVLAASPEPLSKFYGLIYPFSSTLWPFVLGSVVLMSTAFSIFTYFQKVIDTTFGLEMELGVTPFFGFSALIGENMRNETVANHKFSLKLLIGIWLLSCLLLSAGYAGNLRGFLTNPVYSPKIETPRQVIDSGLPYFWHDHGNKVSMEGNPDPDVRILAKNSLLYPRRLSQKLIVEMLYKVYKREIILIEKDSIHTPVYQALFTKPTGETGLIKTRLDGVDLGTTVNAFPKISLLTANFERMQQRTASFGLPKKWQEKSLDVISEINRNILLKANPDLKISLDPPPVLSPFALEDLQAVFLLYIILLGICFLVFLFELFVKQIK